MKNFHLLIFVSLFSTVVMAQDNTFLLYSFKGNISVVENKIESKAKVGKTLNNAASIKVTSGSVVTLICNEAAMFTLNKPGTYQLNKLGDSCKVSSSSVSANYVKYVWNQMTKSSGTAGSNRKAYMNTVGAVSRSINNVWIDPRLDTVNYAGGEFPLSWKSYADAKDFEFLLYNADNISTPFFSTYVGKLKIPIGDIISKIAPGKSYYWTAAIKGEENEEIKVLNYVTKETFEEILNNLKNLGTAYEGPAEQAYRIAFMLEDAHYLSEAYQYYMKATQADTTNPVYRATLMSFKKDYEIK